MICKSQEGWVTSDKIYIRYSINGSEYKRYNSSAMGFSEGAERTNVMSVAIKRDDKISIELWDEDMFDDDDFLGRFTLTCDWAKKGTHDFHQEWGTAHYYIEYNIE